MGEKHEQTEKAYENIRSSNEKLEKDLKHQAQIIAELSQRLSQSQSLHRAEIEKGSAIMRQMEAALEPEREDKSKARMLHEVLQEKEAQIEKLTAQIEKDETEIGSLKSKLYPTAQKKDKVVYDFL